MNAFELYNEKQKPTGVWCCGKCRKLVLSPLWSASSDRPKSTREAAELCCDPYGRMYCFGCDAICMNVQHGKCKLCRDREGEERRQKADAREAELLEKAEDVSASYDGPVYYDGLSGDWGEGFFSDVETLVDRLHDEEADRPEFVFCCKPIVKELDIESAIENLCQDGYEDMDSHLVIPPELTEAVALFNKINCMALHVWETDYTQKVRVAETYATTGEEHSQ